MSFDDFSHADELPPPLYASFSARVRAWLIDVAFLALVLAIVIVVGGLARDVPGSGRVLLILVFGIPMFYEPVLVSRYGATLGHRMSNLRVVSDLNQGNPGFARALFRFVIKAVFGLPSFVTMAFTSRRQAFHDHLTNTTVQLRDWTAARPGDFLVPLVADPSYIMPSRGRRVIVSLLYVAGLFLVASMASAIFVSIECIEENRCTSTEDGAYTLFAVLWLAGSLASIIAGGRGQLPGARRRRREKTLHAITA